MQRYILTGAGLGLYFGYFFRPLRDPSWVTVILISFVAALLTVLISRRRELALAARLKQLPLRWAQYALAVAVLEGRHLAFDAGGKTLVVIMTTIAGALAGAWYGWNQLKSEKPPT